MAVRNIINPKGHRSGLRTASLYGQAGDIHYLNSDSLLQVGATNNSIFWMQAIGGTVDVKATLEPYFLVEVRKELAAWLPITTLAPGVIFANTSPANVLRLNWISSGELFIVSI